MTSPTAGATSVAGGASGTSVSINRPAISSWPCVLVAAMYGQSTSAWVPPDKEWLPILGTTVPLWIKAAAVEPSSYTWNWTGSGNFILTMTPIYGLSGTYG